MRKAFIFIALFLSLQAQAGSSNSILSTLSLTSGMGNTSNDDKSIPSCNLLYGELAWELGYKTSTVAPILHASYRYIGQTTSPDSVNDVNMAGSGYLIGGGLAFEFTRFSFSAVYDALGNYDLEKADSGGAKVSYRKATGYHLSLKYLLSNTWQVVATGSIVKYKEKVAGSTTTDIENNPLQQTLYGFGLGYHF